MSLEGDAEKMFSVEQLWKWFNSKNLTNETAVLVDTVSSYMESIGHMEDQDLMRAFFRHHVGTLYVAICF